MTQHEPERASPAARDHLANERTLLAWIRTSITVIGLGFVIDRLIVAGDSASWQSVLGLVLVVLGALLAGAGGYLYLRAHRELAAGTYRPIVAVHAVVVVVVVIGGLGIAALLLLS